MSKFSEGSKAALEKFRAKRDARMERQFALIERRFPAMRRPLSAIRSRGWWIVRLPIALLFVAGGILSILPFLGLWMLPVGLMLLAVDLPLIRAPLSSMLIRGRRKAKLWRRWWRRKRRR